LPRVPSGVAHLRNFFARQDQGSSNSWYKRRGLCFQLSIEDPLCDYSVCIFLDGGMGMIAFGLECGAVVPEVSLDIIQAIDPAEARREALEWLLMPWLEDLEHLLGCEVRIDKVALRLAPPPVEALPLLVCLDDGRKAHVVLWGEGLGALAPRCTLVEVPLPEWCSIEVTWLLSVPSLSMHEMRAMQRGALLRAKGENLHVLIGNKGVRMAAHWNDDGNVEIDHRINQSHSGRTDWSATQALVTVDELTFDIDVVLSTEHMTVKQLGGLCKGAILPLAPPSDGQRVALVHRGVMVARGELAYVEEEMVVMITDCFGSSAV